MNILRAILAILLGTLAATILQAQETVPVAQDRCGQRVAAKPTGAHAARRERPNICGKVGPALPVASVATVDVRQPVNDPAPVLLNPQPLPPKADDVSPVQLNPQPLPPKADDVSPVLLNPQPLPPKADDVSPVLLNPQPLPPKAKDELLLTPDS
ncbi:hypothetical protein [Sphingomicrobium nitratireducens]|uniref:hypothetical protein n=1 Tax=Sphingomicrobium nitratireducens TaxID=2964666 RepID=UPI002240B7B4|nr:hypothetical protein [Sphingomicrobium nitratireducens]